MKRVETMLFLTECGFRPLKRVGTMLFSYGVWLPSAET